MPTIDNRRIRRHCAYFRGWAQAFGTHDLETDDTRGFRWLLGDDQIGLILTPAVKGLLPADILDLDERPRALAGTVPTACLLSSLQAGTVRLGGFPVAVGDTAPRITQALSTLLHDPADLHLYQTYHLIYPTGTRILTLSQRQPLALIYREIAPLQISLLPRPRTAEALRTSGAAC